MKGFFVLLFLVFCISAMLFAQTWDEVQNIIASDGLDWAEFGGSVSISGNWAVVGAGNDGSNGISAGAIYVFYRNGDNWIEHSKITPSDAHYSQGFGSAVAIDGDYIVVGAPVDGSQSGSIYVFYRDGGNWVESVKLLASDSAADDRFGTSVSISGDKIVAGAPYNDDAGYGSGSAYVFYRSGAAWIEQMKITADDAANGDFFGGSVNVDNNTIIIGAPFAEINGIMNGAAYFFVESGNSWSQQQKIFATDSGESDNFAYSVALENDYAVIGAIYQDTEINGSGSAFVFTRIAGIWEQTDILTISDAAASDYFGNSVSISNNHIVVGSYNDDENGNDSGSAYVFVNNGTNWVEQAKLTASNGAEQDYFGSSVSISNGFILIGASQGDDNGNNSGSAYIYRSSDVAIDNSVPDQQNATYLQSAYPNPFNPETTISFFVKQGDSAVVEIFNIAGQKVRSYPSFSAGKHEIIWNGLDDSGKSVSSGMFLYTLKSNSVHEVRKMLLLK